jgi:hypothetical protein
VGAGRTRGGMASASRADAYEGGGESGPVHCRGRAISGRDPAFAFMAPS